MEKYTTKVMNHLGIVAGICNEINLIKNIDTFIPAPKRKVSTGQAVQSMVLNALGFSNRALYLHSRFSLHKPLDILIGEGIEANDLNDDCLGKALDALYDCGLTELFYKLAAYACSIYKIPHKFVHLDTTTFSLYGKYNSEDKSDTTEVVQVTKGYSKDAHPDLNQVVVSMAGRTLRVLLAGAQPDLAGCRHAARICSYRSSLPVWIETLSGNTSDKASFVKTIKQYKEQFKRNELPCFVADSALYTAEGIKQLEGINWITRVSENIKQVKEHIEAVNKDEMVESTEQGYRWKEIDEEYAGIKQRWLIVFSQQAYDKEYATLAKNIRKENELEEKSFWHLSNQAFACEADAIKAAEKFNKKLKYHKLQYKTEVKNHYEKKGRPDIEKKPVKQEWHLSGNVVIDSEAVKTATARKGFFIIATNELNKDELTNEQMLSVYKAQGVSVERGFRFLKDPQFFAERKIRKELVNLKLTVPDQKGKPTNKPTIRWIFILFNEVLIIYVREGDKLTRVLQNFDDYHENVINCLGKMANAMRM